MKRQRRPPLSFGLSEGTFPCLHKQAELLGCGWLLLRPLPYHVQLPPSLPACTRLSLDHLGPDDPISIEHHLISACFLCGEGKPVLILHAIKHAEGPGCHLAVSLMS